MTMLNYARMLQFSFVVVDDFFFFNEYRLICVWSETFNIFYLKLYRIIMNCG